MRAIRDTITWRRDATDGRRTWLAVMLGMTLMSSLLAFASVARAADPPVASDPAVITTWNGIAVTTIAGPAPTGAGKANVEAFMWFGFVQAAVYNAVNGITGEYELYNWDTTGPEGASPQAAAAAAAHHVLVNYFGGTPTVGPSIAANLDTALATSLALVPNGPAKDQGVQYGIAAADRLISLRANDGRNAPIVYNVPLAPGVWRPTPPANAAFFDPWLGQVKPLMLDSASQFRPGPAPAIPSSLYVAEFAEVRDYGAKTGSLRTAAQTETALFFSDIPVGPIQAALRDLVTRRGLDISDSARLLAAVDMSLADSAIAVWDAKFLYGWWRPITAIREAETDGNPLTVGVPAWEPLIANPPYPDWPSGLTGVIGALSTTLSRLNVDGRVDLNLTSVAAGQGGPAVARHYDDAAVIQKDAIDARVWSGIHFHSADTAGVAMGVQVGNWALDHYFAAVPTPIPSTPALQITAPPTEVQVTSQPASGQTPWLALSLFTILAISVSAAAMAVRRH